MDYKRIKRHQISCTEYKAAQAQLQNRPSEGSDHEMQVDESTMPGVVGEGDLDDSMDLDGGRPLEEDEEMQPVHEIEDTGRPTRSTKRPARFDDFQLSTQSAVRRGTRKPQPLPIVLSPVQSPVQSPIPSPIPSPNPTQVSPSPPPVPLPSQPPIECFPSTPGSAGLFRIHRYFSPQTDPAVSDGSGPLVASTREPTDGFGKCLETEEDSDLSNFSDQDSDHSPYPNVSLSLIARWFHGAPSRLLSQATLNGLLKILRHPKFSIPDLAGFSARRLLRLQSKAVPLTTINSSDPFFKRYAGWIEGSVAIPLPRARVKQTEEKAVKLEVNKVYHRKLHQTIMSELEEPYTANFYFKPFKQFFKPLDGGPIQRVYSEGYMSDRMLALEDEVMQRVQGRDIEHEIGIIAISLYSDGTLLAQFGGDTLWPAYMTFQNWSKYDRLKPSSHAMNHIIYFPSVRIFY